jgi:cGMP-dependent protein kinase 2
LNRAERIQTVTETLALNSEYLIGLPEVHTSGHKDLTSIEMKILDKTHNRYANIYNQSC